MIVGLVVIIAGVACISLVRAASAFQEARSELVLSEAQVREGDFHAAAMHMGTARTALERGAEVIHSMGAWRAFPGIGVQLRALENGSRAASEALEGGRDLLLAFASVADVIPSVHLFGGVLPDGNATRRLKDISAEEKREMLAALSAALPTIRIARDKIVLANQLWEQVPATEMIGPLRRALAPLAEALPRLQQTLDEAVPLSEVAIPLLGYPRPMRYLVVLQNSDELRPGGGFIGNVGMVTLDAGDVKQSVFTDVYAVDNPVSAVWRDVPPAPLERYLGVDAWFFRDANWSPDFPTSAERMLDTYTREIQMASSSPGEMPNAVIALEPGLFRELLRFTGPITVQGMTFTADNFFDQLEYEVEQGFLKRNIPLAERKGVLLALGASLQERLFALPVSQVPVLIDIVSRAVQRKQIMVYARDSEALAILDARGWTARAKETRGDFLWTVDANLAALKTDGVMQKQVTYTAHPDKDGRYVATVALQYKNTNRMITWRYTRYRSYTRVYVPEGSEFIRAEGAMENDRHVSGGRTVPGQVDVMHELGKTVFGAFWAVEPGETRTLSFTYRLPPTVSEAIRSGEYHLDWPKQAGADQTELTLDLNFGKNIVSATPPEDADQWGDARYRYQTDSLEDRIFNVSFVKPIE